jgi:hypothetical protein
MKSLSALIICHITRGTSFVARAVSCNLSIEDAEPVVFGVNRTYACQVHPASLPIAIKAWGHKVGAGLVLPPQRRAEFSRTEEVL